MSSEKTLVFESAACFAITISEDLTTGVLEAKPGNLAKSIKTLDHLTPELQASYDACNKAEALLKPHKGILCEKKARELIHETGFPTFPRPAGIPEHYQVQLSGKGVGMKYVDPLNPGNSIRVMPGKPHSPWPHQQKPYITEHINGQCIDNIGNIVDGFSAEAHIPIKEYLYKGN